MGEFGGRGDFVFFLSRVGRVDIVFSVFFNFVSFLCGRNVVFFISLFIFFRSRVLIRIFWSSLVRRKILFLYLGGVWFRKF